MNAQLDINQIILVIGAVCGAVIVVGGAASVIRRWLAPFMKMQDRVQKLEYSRDKTEEGVEVLCKCMLALMDNALSGDSDTAIKTARDEMQSYLIRR